MTNAALWPEIARIFGLDESGRYVKRFEFVMDGAGVPEARVIFAVSGGAAMALTEVIRRYELHVRAED